MSSDGRRRSSFTERLREQAKEAIYAHRSLEGQYLDGLDLWSLLRAAADLIEAQRKELDVLRQVDPLVASFGGERPLTSQRIIRERGYEFVDYDGESIKISAREGENLHEDIFFDVVKFGEGPVIMGWEEFAQFLKDGNDLMEKIQGTHDD